MNASPRVERASGVAAIAGGGSVGGATGGTSLQPQSFSSSSSSESEVATLGMVSEQHFQESLDALVANEHNWMGVLTSSPSSNDPPQHSNPRSTTSTTAWTSSGNNDGTSDNHLNENNNRLVANHGAAQAMVQQDHSSLLSSHAFSAFLQGAASSSSSLPQQPSLLPPQATGLAAQWAALTNPVGTTTTTPTSAEAAVRQQNLIASAGLAALLGFTSPPPSVPLTTEDGPSSGPSVATTHQQQVTFAPIHSASREVKASLPPPPPTDSTASTGGVTSTSNKRRRKSGAAAAVSTSTSKSATTTTGRSSVSAVSEDEGGATIRQRDRNHREQQRSQHIAQQIAALRELLSTSKVRFKPDKYSTLVTVADFIRSLQEKSEILDAEHQKLLATIVQTTQAVNGQHLPPQTQASSVTMTATPWAGVGGGGGSLTGFGCDTDSSNGNNAQLRMSDVFEETSDGKISPLETDGDDAASANASSTYTTPPPTTFVSTLDYKAIFECCPVASAVTSIDGRFLDCNPDFEALSGFAKRELLNRPPSKDGGGTATASGTDANELTTKSPPKSLSLFNVVRREHMESVFRAMSEMLKMPFPAPTASGPDASSSGETLELESDYWSDTVTLVRPRASPKVRQCERNPALEAVARLTATCLTLPLSSLLGASFGLYTVQVKLGVSLVRNPQGRPKFFSCTLLPVDYPPPIGEVVTCTAAVG